MKLNDKENYIKRLKKGFQCLEELAIEKEQELEAKLRDQTRNAQSLNDELKKLKEKHLALISSEQERNNEQKSLKDKLLAAEERIEYFTTRPNTFKIETEALLSELKMIKIEILT